MIEPILDETRADTVYRVLTVEEVKSLDPIFTARGAVPPVGIYCGAVRGKSILGFCVLQAKLHVEPWWIAPEHPEVFAPLAHQVEEFVLTQNGPTYVYLFAPEGRVSELASTMGMEKYPESIFYKLVAAPTPPAPFASLQPIEQMTYEDYMNGPARDDAPLLLDSFDDSVQETIQ